MFQNAVGYVTYVAAIPLSTLASQRLGIGWYPADTNDAINTRMQLLVCVLLAILQIGKAGQGMLTAEARCTLRVATRWLQVHSTATQSVT
jgi:hypothetical protein